MNTPSALRAQSELCRDAMTGVIDRLNGISVASGMRYTLITVFPEHGVDVYYSPRMTGFVNNFLRRHDIAQQVNAELSSESGAYPSHHFDAGPGSLATISANAGPYASTNLGTNLTATLSTPNHSGHSGHFGHSTHSGHHPGYRVVPPSYSGISGHSAHSGTQSVNPTFPGTSSAASVSLPSTHYAGETIPAQSSQTLRRNLSLPSRTHDLDAHQANFSPSTYLNCDVTPDISFISVSTSGSSDTSAAASSASSLFSRPTSSTPVKSTDWSVTSSKDWKEHAEGGHRAHRAHPKQLQLTDTIAVTRYIYDCLLVNLQSTCRQIAKAWIKAVEPKKQSRYPYKRRDASRPPWWPEHVEHREPDHLLKAERVALLEGILRSDLVSIDLLRKTTQLLFGNMENERYAVVFEMLDVVEAERALRQGKPVSKVKDVTNVALWCDILGNSMPVPLKVRPQTDSSEIQVRYRVVQGGSTSSRNAPVDSPEDTSALQSRSQDITSDFGSDSFAASGSSSENVSVMNVLNVHRSNVSEMNEHVHRPNVSELSELNVRRSNVSEMNELNVHKTNSSVQNTFEQYASLNAPGIAGNAPGVPVSAPSISQLFRKTASHLESARRADEDVKEWQSLVDMPTPDVSASNGTGLGITLPGDYTLSHAFRSPMRSKDNLGSLAVPSVAIRSPRASYLASSPSNLLTPLSTRTFTFNRTPTRQTGLTDSTVTTVTTTVHEEYSYMFPTPSRVVPGYAEQENFTPSRVAPLKIEDITDRIQAAPATPPLGITNVNTPPMGPKRLAPLDLDRQRKRQRR